MTLGPSAALRGLALVIAVVAIFALGTSCSHDVPTAAHVAPTPNPPVPNSPLGVVDLFQWSMDHRDLPHFEELFTSDFQLVFAASDSGGNPYRTKPFTRDDILIAAHDLFVSTRSISLIFDWDPQDSDDLRVGMNPRWHQQVQLPSLTLTIEQSHGSVLHFGGGLLVYTARGDSAAVPQDLLNRGIKPDSTRWMIGRIEDQTNRPVVATTFPSQVTTLGRQLLLYWQ
jgi:hypothetical protein